jgi:hypothetical protein
MGFSTQDDYLTKVYTNGQMQSFPWYKALGAVGAFTAGRWYNMGYFTGYPMVSRFGERMINGQLMNNNAGTITNWTLGTNWTYAGTALPPTIAHTGGNTATAVATGTLSLAASSIYGLEFWCSAWGGAANFTVSLGGTAVTATSATGQYHYVVTATNTTDLTITPVSANTCTLSNFSVVLLGTGIPLFDTDMGGLYTGGNVSTKTKHLLSSFISTPSSATSFYPGTWKLVDVLMSYPVNMSVSTAQTLTTIGGNYSVAFGAVSGTPWTYGSGWAYSSGTTVTGTNVNGNQMSLPVANFSAGNTGGPIQNATNATTGGKYTYVYNVTYTIASLTGSGTITVGLGGTTTTAAALANGTFTQFITPVNSSGGLIFTVAGATNSFSLSNVTCTVALPRYPTGDGVKAMLCWHSGAWSAAGSGVASAAAHNLSFTYTNSSNTTGKANPIVTAGFSGAVPTMGHIDNSGTAVNNIGPFFALSYGDTGIQSVQTFTCSATTANAYCELILCKEILTMPHASPASASGASVTERDFLNQARTMPQIQDGANLQWIFMPGVATAAASVVHGQFKTVWG